MPSARQNLSLEVAILASLLLHAMMFGAWQYRQSLAGFPLFRPLARILNVVFAPAKFAPSKPALQTITFVEVPAPAPPKAAPKPPQQFMETDNRQVTGEQPKDAKYYSDRATVAANPENPTGKTGETPFLNGKETRMMSTENVVPDLGAAPSLAPAPRSPPSPQPPMPRVPANPEPTKPVTPTPPTATSTAEQPKPRDVAPKGLNAAEPKQLAMIPRELALAPPVVPAQPSSPVHDEPTPAASPALAPASPGRASQREIGAAKSHLAVSGVTRIGVAAFNVEDSPFGAYDKQIITAVQSRWYALIEQQQLYERAGTVTVRFYLMEDGNVQTDAGGHPVMDLKENTAGVVLASFCELAILKSAPFEPLPEKLRTLIGNEPREVNFTFYY
jgi:hypothetical protein